MLERLQKILAQAGYGSCRTCEDFIYAVRVRVNGQIARLGQKADPTIDKITVDGGPIAAAESLAYIALYKPRNVLTAVQNERGDARQTVRDLVDAPGHLYPVGRLDFESEGLVLMTKGLLVSYFLPCLVIRYPVFQQLRMGQKLSDPIPNCGVNLVKSTLWQSTFDIRSCPIVSSTPVIKIVSSCILCDPQTGMSVHPGAP